MKLNELKVGEVYEYVGSDPSYLNYYDCQRFVFNGPHPTYTEGAACNAVVKLSGREVANVYVQPNNLRPIVRTTIEPSTAVCDCTCDGHTLLHFGCMCGRLNRT